MATAMNSFRSKVERDCILEFAYMFCVDWYTVSAILCFLVYMCTFYTSVTLDL